MFSPEDLRAPLRALREEYEGRCAEAGTAPSTVLEFDETLEVLKRVEKGGAGRDLGRYAQTALGALASFPKASVPRGGVVQHALLPVAYGAKVAGCMEILLKAQELCGRKLETWTYVDELPGSSFNGRAFYATTCEGAFCMLDHGLFRLLHHVCLGVYLIVNSRDGGDEDKPYEKNPHLRTRAVSVVQETMQAYLEDRSHRLVMPAAGWLDESGFIGASELSFAMKLFVLAHEMAHVQLGHLERLATGVTGEEQVLMEYEADRTAQQMLQLVETHRLSPVPVLGGGMAFLLTDFIRTAVFRNLHAINPKLLSKSGGHPSAINRIQRLDHLLQEYFHAHRDCPRERLGPLKLLQWIAQDVSSPGNLSNQE